MTRILFQVAGSLIIALSLSGCDENSGALLGALLAIDDDASNSDNLVRAFYGSLIGAKIGADIGRSLDKHTEEKIAYGLYMHSDNEPYHWSGQDNNYKYTLIPEESFSYNGQECRPYHLQVNIDGVVHESRGKACKSYGCHWNFVDANLKNRIGNFNFLQLTRVLDGRETAPYQWRGPGNISYAFNIINKKYINDNFKTQFRLIVGADTPNLQVIEGTAWRSQNCAWHIQ